MVITGLTRNQFAGNRTWVRIPPAPPNKDSRFDTMSNLLSVISCLETLENTRVFLVCSAPAWSCLKGICSRKLLTAILACLPVKFEPLYAKIEKTYGVWYNAHILQKVGSKMGKVSKKENKTPFHTTREELGYSREKASELLGWISPERIEKIENEKSMPHPEEVLAMASTYKSPKLCNHYCANLCPIGHEYVPEIKIKDLSQIVLEMLASLNAMHRKQERLIEITADGQISGDEIGDFVHIQEELERISITVETLQLWAERMLATGAIDMEAYNKHKNNK